ncbi:MAG: branched-chain amino acid ABC transporter permease [Hyphomicrobiaceae bacterium]
MSIVSMRTLARSAAARAVELPASTLVLAALAAALAIAPLLARLGPESYILSLLTRAMILAIAVVSLNLLVGYGALVSLGHAAFLGIGAYAVAILSHHGLVDLIAHLAAAVLVAALFAAATSAVSLRASGVYYIMSTLAFGQMLFFLAVSLSAYGGDDGLTLPGRSLALGFRALASDVGFYYAVLATLLGAYAISRSIVASRFGRVLRGIRENPVRMQAIGFAPFPYQLVACIVAGAMCAVAGVLLANQTEFVSPAYMTWQRSVELLAMVILGGLGTLHGPILGAIAFLLLEEALSGLTEHWKLIFAPLLILVVLEGKGGLAGLISRLGGSRDG